MAAFAKSLAAGVVLRSGSPLSGAIRTLSRYRRMTESDPTRTWTTNFAVLHNSPDDVVG